MLVCKKLLPILYIYNTLKIYGNSSTFIKHTMPFGSSHKLAVCIIKLTITLLSTACGKYNRPCAVVCLQVRRRLWGRSDQAVHESWPTVRCCSKTLWLPARTLMATGSKLATVDFWPLPLQRVTVLLSVAPVDIIFTQSVCSSPLFIIIESISYKF